MLRKIIQFVTDSSFRTKVLAVLPIVLFACITVGFSVAYSTDLGDGYSSGSGAPPECIVDTVAPPAYVQKIGRDLLIDSSAEHIALDTNGNIYVTDSANDRVLKFDSTGGYQTQWGSRGSEDGKFNKPYDIAIDTLGQVIVIDRENNRIQKFDSSGNFISKWGTYGAGNGQFSQPYGVATDSDNNVYVSDVHNRIQKFDASGNYLTQWGGYGTNNSQFNFPTGITFDSSGKLYVADTNNHRIQVFNSTGTFITKWGTYGTSDGQFNTPFDTGVDSFGNVYVTDMTNNRIQKFDSSGNFISKWGTYGADEGQLVGPRGVALDQNNNVFVADSGNKRVQKFAPGEGGDFTSIKYAQSGPTEALQDDGIYKYSSTSGGASDLYNLTNFSFNIPLGATISGIQAEYEDYLTGGGVGGASGYLQLWKGGVLVGSQKDMTISTINTVYTTTSDLWNTTWTPAEINNSQFGVRVWISGYNRNVYVDYVKLTIAYSVTVDVTMVVSTDGYPGQAQFTNPQGTAVDVSGNIYVVDTGNDRIQKYNSTGAILDEWGSTGSGSEQFSSPTGIALDDEGHIYVTDLANRRVQKFDLSGNFISSINTPYTSSPSAIAVDDSGNVYVSDVDAYGNKVMKYSSSGSLVTQWGSSGLADGEFNNPKGIAVDSNGYVYVVDMNNSRIQKFSSSGSFVSKWGSNGSDNGQFSSPQGVTVDSMGNVYVSEAGNDRIQKFDSSGNFITKWGSQGTSNGLFDNPYGLYVDSLDNVYVADSGNNRIQKFTFDKVTVSTPDGVTEGGSSQYYSVVLNTAPSSDVTVTLSVSNPASGSSITVSPSTLTFTASDWNTPQEVTITPDDDATYTGNRSASISYSMVSVDTGFNCTILSDTTVSITEDESIPIVALATPQPAPTLEPLIANRLSGGFDANGECIMQRPGGKPDIFRIDMTDTKATLYIAPPSKPYTQFYITYEELGSVAQETGSLSSKLWTLGSLLETTVYAESPEYAIDFTHENDGGVVVYTINELKPNTKYEFTIKCSNKCAFAETGNTLGASTIGPGSSAVKTYLAYNQSTDTQSPHTEHQLVNAGSPAVISIVMGPVFMILGFVVFFMKSGHIHNHVKLSSMRYSLKNPRIIRYKI